MLDPIKPPRYRRKRILTYDLEWVPGSMTLALVGVYDGVKYRKYNTVADFLDSELTGRNAGALFYAHAGGLADVQFVLEALLKDDRYRAEGSFSGSSAVIVRIMRGNLSWYFIDSYFTLRAKLADIGSKMGMEKGDVDWGREDILDYLRSPEGVAYNEQDNRILWTALSEFQGLILGLSSELRFTLASTAMRLIRRRYLKRKIPTSAMLNARLRPAYVGGRVEVFYRARHSGWYYDINSCYPYAMTKPLPGRYLGLRKGLGDGRTAVIAEVTMTVPDTMQVPPLPWLHGDGLYFPVGKRRSWLVGPEIQLALSLGCELNAIHEAHHFEWFSDLARYANELYDLRMKSSGYYVDLYKLLLNSGYGKFGERPEKGSLLFRPTFAELQEAKMVAKEGGGRDRKGRYYRGFLGLISPGVFLMEREAEIEHAHVPIAAYVTSYARVNLYEHLTRTGKTPYYCDTDGFAIGSADVPTGTGLGNLKLEKVYTDALFFAPKLYHMHTAAGRNIVRAKGFRNLDLSEFNRLIQGDSIQVTRMLRLKELYSKGLTKPTEALIEKRLKHATIPKRCFAPDGTSRPWRVSELIALHEKRAIHDFEGMPLDIDSEL
jgi:hypothetical protein